MRLKDKVAIITGAGSGIGRETSFLFSNEGAKVVVADICEQSGEDTVRRIKETGTGFFFKVNVSDRDQLRQLATKTMDTYGRIDILVNNAGVTQDAFLAKMTDEQWNKVIDVNLKGVFNCIQVVAPIMISQSKGVIINASSVVGLFGNVGQTNYAAAKAGVVGMTKALAKELGPKGIRVNAVAPGFIVSPMTEKVPGRILEMMKAKTPLGRLGETKDVAYAYLFLASDESSFVNGAVLCVDGGLTI
jgi:3-oxoacyl-[acyl-carrier protein] reductase